MASTDDELVEYYAKLLILQYAGKPKAVATVSALVREAIMNQLPIQVGQAFDLETAVGVQLDVVGKYAGVVRTGYDFTGPITLDDDDFRSLIKMAIVKNNAGSSLSDIQDLLNFFFPGTFLVFDYQNMQMDYFFSAEIGSVQLAEMFVRNGLLPKPMGVLVGALIYAPTINNFYGFRTFTYQSPNIRGFNSYADYSLEKPWLNYDDAIVINGS